MDKNSIYKCRNKVKSLSEVLQLLVIEKRLLLASSEGKGAGVKFKEKFIFGKDIDMKSSLLSFGLLHQYNKIISRHRSSLNLGSV